MRYSDLSGFKNMKPRTKMEQKKKNRKAKYITYTSLNTCEQKYISYVIFTIKSK